MTDTTKPLLKSLESYIRSFSLENEVEVVHDAFYAGAMAAMQTMLGSPGAPSSKETFEAMKAELIEWKNSVERTKT